MARAFDLQALVFDAGRWSAAEAARWAKREGYDVKKVGATPREIRIRSRAVAEFEGATLVEVDSGIRGLTFVMGIPKANASATAREIVAMAKATGGLRANPAGAGELRELFVGRPPRGNVEISLPTRRLPRALALLGPCPQVNYIATKDHHDGRRAEYYHRFGKMPYLAATPDKRMLVMVLPRGGRFRITGDGLED